MIKRYWAPGLREGVLAELRRKTRSQYHQVYRMVVRHEGELRADKIGQALTGGSVNEVWSSVRFCNSRKINYPSNIDGVRGVNEIANLFADKFEVIYNCVGYDEAHLRSLRIKVDDRIRNMYTNERFSQSSEQSISPMDIGMAIQKLQNNKADGNGELMSDHIIHGGGELNVHLSYLLTSMIWHGQSPGGMIIGTMVPMPKGKWTNSCLSDNYRAITLSSIIGKLLDIIIMSREEKQLSTSDLQFSFKKGASTSLCTCMVQETVSYFVSRNTNVYGLLLDASKAFDRLNYIKLFEILISRNICPLICRLLLNMYINQKLRTRWNGQFSESFGVTNGVKQGGVISPVLFCIYMDGLLKKLESSDVGCYVGRVFSGAFAYADDLTLLCPSVSALKEMVAICSDYASEYDIKFNASKSQLIIFKSKKRIVPDPVITLNGDKIGVVDSVIHLGHILHDNIYKYDISKCVRDFNRQCNLFLANFKFATSHVRNFLFHKYCSSFYGSQILPIYDDSFKDLFKAWRIAIRRVWRVPWRTHCNMLPHLADVMAPELWFMKRAINFANLALFSTNDTVRYISNMGIHNSNSIFGGNVRFLDYSYHMNGKNVLGKWKSVCEDEADIIRVVEQVKELCKMRDRFNEEFLNSEQCSQIIEFLCTD